MNNGGGVYNHNGLVNLVGADLNGNISLNKGGGIMTHRGMVTVSSSVIRNNTAMPNMGHGAFVNARFTAAILEISDDTIVSVGQAIVYDDA